MGIGNGQVFYRWVILVFFSIGSLIGNRVALGVSCSDVFKAVTPIVAPASLTSAQKLPELQDWILSESRHNIPSYDRWKSVVQSYRAGLEATIATKLSERAWYQRFASKDSREIRAELQRVDQMLERGDRFRSLLKEPKLFDFFVILEVIQKHELRETHGVWSSEELNRFAESIVKVDGTLSEKIKLALIRYRAFCRSGLNHWRAFVLTRESLKGKEGGNNSPLSYVSMIHKMIGSVDWESVLVLSPVFVDFGFSEKTRILIAADVRDVQGQFPGLKGHLVASVFADVIRTHNLFGLKRRVLAAMEIAQALNKKTGHQSLSIQLAKTASEMLLGEVDRDLKFISAISEIFWRNRPKDSNPVHFALTEKGIRTLGRIHELRAFLDRMKQIEKVNLPEKVPLDVLIRILE